MGQFATSMLMTDVEDEMWWLELYDVVDGLAVFLTNSFLFLTEVSGTNIL